MNNNRRKALVKSMTNTKKIWLRNTKKLLATPGQSTQKLQNADRRPWIVFITFWMLVLCLLNLADKPPHSIHVQSASTPSLLNEAKPLLTHDPYIEPQNKFPKPANPELDFVSCRTGNIADYPSKCLSNNEPMGPRWARAKKPNPSLSFQSRSPFVKDSMLWWKTSEHLIQQCYIMFHAWNIVHAHALIQQSAGSILRH